MTTREQVFQSIRPYAKILGDKQSGFWFRPIANADDTDFVRVTSAHQIVEHNHTSKSLGFRFSGDSSIRIFRYNSFDYSCFETFVAMFILGWSENFSQDRPCFMTPFASGSDWATLLRCFDPRANDKGLFERGNPGKVVRMIDLMAGGEVVAVQCSSCFLLYFHRSS